MRPLGDVFLFAIVKLVKDLLAKEIMMKKVRLFFLLIYLLLPLTACSKQASNQPKAPQVATVNFQKKYQLKATPTLFFHGALSNYKSEENIVKTAQNNGITNSVIRVDVSADGKVKFLGELRKDAINPIVEVNYKNNIQLDFNKAGQYATNVVKALQQKYGITQINMVAHSLGNVSVMYYLMKNYDKKLPRLNKQVAIAGHFNGVALKQAPLDLRSPQNVTLSQSGKPSKMNKSYKNLLKLRKIYPQEKTQVLNIVGDKNANSDGLVDNTSSESLKYLVGNDQKYHLAKFYGASADHGRLTYNSQVIIAILQFLWS